MKQFFSSHDNLPGGDGRVTSSQEHSSNRRPKRNNRNTSSSRFRKFANTALAVCVCIGSYGPQMAFAFAVVERTNHRPIHRIVFGTAALSTAENPMSILDSAYEKGFRRFDLARTYGAGASERIFGEWMEQRGIDRSELNIITKGGMGKDKYGDPNRPLLTRGGFHEEFAASLEVIKTDTVDLYMYHRDDPRIPAEEFCTWANELIEAGQAKSWGVSNWSYERFRQAHDFAVANNMAPPCANSPQFSLASPKCEIWPTTQTISGHEHTQQIQWYEENNVELLCWEVLAKGFMAKPDLWKEEDVDPSTFDDPVEIGSNEWRLQRLQKAYCHPENYRRRRVAIQLADKFGGKLSQIAMLYPLCTGKHVSVIFGSTNPKNMEDMIELQHLYLDDEAMTTLKGNAEGLPVSIPPQELIDTAAANNVIKSSLGRNKQRAFSKLGFSVDAETEKEKAESSKSLFRLYAFKNNTKD
jgi:aryl-alcohol dehydrogenase-like predicted oxidoreductase